MSHQSGNVRPKRVAMGQSVDQQQIARLVEERNAAVREYHLVMSERDSVHKEMERLQESLNESQRRVTVLHEEKRSALDEATRAKREVSALQMEKDRILQECYELRLKYNVSTKYSSKICDQDSHTAIPSLASIRSSISRVAAPSPGLRAWAFPSTGSLSKSTGCSSSSCSALTQQIRPEPASLTALHDEIETIRLKMSQLERDLTESRNEAELSKRRRDWAIAEKKKIATERESMKQLCDYLRQERNQRDRELSKALAENEELKRQLHEAIQALNDHHSLQADRCHVVAGHDMESPLSTSAACSSDPLILPTACSRDSAIYADLLDMDSDQLSETTCKLRGNNNIPTSNSACCRQHASPLPPNHFLPIGATTFHSPVEKPKPGQVRDIVISKKSGAEPLGIKIFWNETNGSIFISAVSENSIAAQAGLQVGDQLLDVNGVNMRCQATRKIASTVLCQTKKLDDDLKIRVQYNPDKFDEYSKLRDDSQASSACVRLSSPPPVFGATGTSSLQSQARGGRRS